MTGKTTVWKSSDGRLHEDKATWRRHEAWLELREMAAGMLSEALNDDVADENPDVLRLTGALLERADDIARILRAKPERAP